MFTFCEVHGSSSGLKWNDSVCSESLHGKTEGGRVEGGEERATC